MMIANPTGFTEKLEKDTIVMEAVDAECIVCDNAVARDQSSSGMVREGLEGNGSSGGDAAGVLGGAGGMGCSGGNGGGGAGGSGAGDGDVGGKVEEVSGGEEGRPRTNSIEPPDATKPNEHNVKRVCANTTERKQKLVRLLSEVGPTLCWQDKDRLCQLLLSHHQAFGVDEGDTGETDLIQMTIDTGDAPPRRQPVHGTPFAIRTEVARQLREMRPRE